MHECAEISDEEFAAESERAHWRNGCFESKRKRQQHPIPAKRGGHVVHHSWHDDFREHRLWRMTT